MKIKYSELSPEVRRSLDLYAITLIKYYKSKGLEIEKNEVKKIISEKLKKVELTGAAGNFRDEIITLKKMIYLNLLKRYLVKKNLKSL